MLMRRLVGLLVVLGAATLSVATSEEEVPLLSVVDDNELRVFFDGERAEARVRVIGDGPIEELISETTAVIVDATLTEVDPQAAGVGACTSSRAPFGVTGATFTWDDGTLAGENRNVDAGPTVEGSHHVLTTEPVEARFACGDACEATGVLTFARTTEFDDGCVAADLLVRAEVVFLTQDHSLDTSGLIVVIERMDDESP